MMKLSMLVVLLVCVSVVLAVDNDSSMEYGQCYTGLMTCAKLVKNFQGSAVYRTPNTIKNGFSAICRNVTEIAQCAVKVKPCPADFTDIFNKAFNAINFVCVDKIDDIVKHWDCMQNTNFNRVDNCTRFENMLDDCKTDEIMYCADNMIARNSQWCKPGASDLVRDLANKLVSIIPECSQRKHMNWMALAFLRN